MKKKELQLIKDLNVKYNSNLKPTENDYEIFDAQTDKSVIEIKIRDVIYDTHYIQVDKFYNLLMVGEALNKNPFYLVKDPSGVYSYNLNELKEEIITSEIVPKFAPYRTEFNNNKKITKYFYELHKYNSVNLLK
tara:strand:+ start:16766 stop:17167 length:402 start_codon:yes stop_codon:yes gene_type:complete